MCGDPSLIQQTIPLKWVINQLPLTRWVPAGVQPHVWCLEEVGVGMETMFSFEPLLALQVERQGHSINPYSKEQGCSLTHRGLEKGRLPGGGTPEPALNGGCC